ncbi:MAG: M23 family metallopeptidase [bacterium]
MASKRFTILIIPDKSSGLRRFVVARRTLWMGGLFMIALVASSILLLLDRSNLEQNLNRLPVLKRRADAQNRLLRRIRNRLGEVDQRLLQLRRLEDQLRIMASVKPNEKSRDLGVGGVSKGDLLDQVAGLSASESRLAGRLGRQFQDVEQRAAEQESAFEELIKAFREKRVLLAHTPSILPVRGWLTSAFGHRRSAFTGRREFHAGIDIVARRGSPVSAPADGVVIMASRESGYGNTIEIRHLQGITTRYAHNQKMLVRVGQRVRRGQVIARVGSSGRSTGPHLHYEVRLNGLAVNPRIYIVDTLIAKR